MWSTFLEILHELKSIKSMFGCQSKVCSKSQRKRGSHTAIFFVSGAQDDQSYIQQISFEKEPKSGKIISTEIFSDELKPVVFLIIEIEVGRKIKIKGTFPRFGPIQILT